VNNIATEKIIYLTRHGETDYNKKGYLQGSSIDSSLNELGKKQADLFFEAYKHRSFDKIYTSVLKRSIESVEKFIHSGIKHEAFPELNEINWGRLEGKLLNPVSWIKLRNLAKKWENGKTHLKIEGGESPEDVMLRQKSILDLIISRSDENTILVCMHGRALRVFICLLTNTLLTQMDTFHHSNMGLYVLKYNYLSKTCTVEINNCRKHLMTVK